MKIFCIGRNYVDHIAELQNQVPSEPVLFMKPQTALLKSGEIFYHPEFSNDIHYECEVVLRVHKSGKHIAPQFAHNYIKDFSLGIDFTARDIQETQKKKGLPWEIAKSFDQSAVIGNEFQVLDWDAPILFDFYQNGIVKQSGNTTMCIYDFRFIVSYISKFFTLQAGDLIYTGTPSGVGKIAIGDQLEGKLGAKIILSCSIK
jgi:2-keto-4-pentenoate hydratase/2-oxohepta-3-ene-1,7-dioic acid hydratase in catechol pathway